MNDTFMKEKPVFPLILSMALPMVISMLVNSLYNIVDQIFIADRDLSWCRKQRNCQQSSDSWACIICPARCSSDDRMHPCDAGISGAFYF